MNSRRVETFCEAWASAGAQAALEYLSHGVPHRYTAVYRLRDGRLQNMLLHDKSGEVRPEYLAEVALETSFCQFVLRDGVFMTADSATDGRLAGHPYQGVMVAYHGVPIVRDGGLWGTLCHFDVTQRSLPDQEFELMQRAALALSDLVETLAAPVPSSAA